MDDYFWMTRALLIAKKALSLNELPVGSVLVFNNFELAMAGNFCCSSFFYHSEIILINKSRFYFSNQIIDESVLYVTLEPCPTCVLLMSSYNINRVVFGSYGNKDLYKNYIKEIKMTGGILLSESVFLMQTFFLKKRFF